jgi:transient receptor potential cation channel subfamily C protein 4
MIFFFIRMSSTFKTVFWSLFGLAEKEGVQLLDFDKKFTEIVGYLIYGAFNIASVIVLLNMLIAMMSKSYETIEEHADVEWKFARSKLYMEYIKEGRISTYTKRDFTIVLYLSTERTVFL